MYIRDHANFVLYFSRIHNANKIDDHLSFSN